MRPAVLLSLCLAWAFAGQALAQGDGFKSDWEGNLRSADLAERPVELPAPPRSEELTEIFVSSANDFKFFIDRKSLSTGSDGVVRYSLVARSPSGVDNVTYEGIRCAKGEVRVYAIGRPDGSWVKPVRDQWRTIEVRSVQRWHLALWREYFCPLLVPIADVAEGLNALDRGRHPTIGSVRSGP